MRRGGPIAFLSALAALAALWACESDDPAGSRPELPDGAPVETGVPPEPDAGDAAPPGSTALYQSGTRLRAEVLALDGVKQLAGFFDTTRSERCGFGTSAAGLRCAPRAHLMVYSDAACTKPAAVRLACDEAVPYAARYEPVDRVCIGQGSQLAELRTIGASIGPGQAYMKSLAGSCDPDGAPDAALFALGDVVPLTSLARADRVISPFTSEIALEKYVGEDGSFVVNSEQLIDRGRDAGCEATRLGPPTGTEARCIPQPYAFSDDTRGPFADPACTTPAGYTVRADCPAPRGIRRVEQFDGGTGACVVGRTFSFLSVGAVLPSAYRSSGASCMAADFGTTYVAAAGPFPIDSLPAVPFTRFGTGPVRVESRSSQGVRLEHGRLWDEAAKRPCVLRQFADGKRYCAPVGSVDDQQQVYFKNAACTQRIVEPLCEPLSYVLTNTHPNICPQGPYATSIHPLGPIFETSTRYFLSGVDCQPVPGATKAQDFLPPVQVATVLPSVAVTRE